MGELSQLWQRYKSLGTGGEPGLKAELRRQLIEAYAPLARYVVERLNLKPGPCLGYEDLLGQAVVGLIEAVDRFDPERGIKFETYAYHRIRGAVMDMLRDMDWLPRSVRQREAEVAAAYARLQENLGRPPTDEELAAALGVTVEALGQIGHEVALQASQSLDEVIGGGRASPDLGPWETGTLGDSIADQAAPLPEEHMERMAERDMLATAIRFLPEAERTVISLYYHEGLTLKEVGQVLGVTESRACQIHGKAILRLRSQVQALLQEPVVSTSPGAPHEHR